MGGATALLVEVTTTTGLVCAAGVVAAGGLGDVFGVGLGVGVGVGAGLGVEVVRGGAGAAGLSSMKAYGHLCRCSATNQEYSEGCQENERVAASFSACSACLFIRKTPTATRSAFHQSKITLPQSALIQPHIQSFSSAVQSQSF